MARLALARLGDEHPGDAATLCSLDHRDPFELLVATVLSAQTTDERVNTVTPTLFTRYPDAAALAGAAPVDLEAVVQPLGFFRQKARSLLGLAGALEERHDGAVPSSYADLTALPGVGRKTANVVRSVALGLPGLPVDTHVLRVSGRLGLTAETDPVKVEAELDPMVPARERGRFSLVLILHGRQVCVARRPRCDVCAMSDVCPSSFLGAASTTASRSGTT